MAGLFITLEGVEGAGKSSVARYLQETLQAQGQQVVLTREPGGTPLAEDIRTVLLADYAENMSSNAELLLMFAARSIHWENHIQPALNAGKVVICDRFVDASFAYQGAGRGLPVEKIETLAQWVLDGHQPDQVFVFDLPIEQGLARAKSRGETNRFEEEDLAFMQRVRQAYLARAQADASRYHLVDAGQNFQAVATDVLTQVQALLT